MHVTSFFNNPRLLHHKIPGALPHLVLKFECILLLPGPNQFFKFHIRFYIKQSVPISFSHNQCGCTLMFKSV